MMDTGHRPLSPHLQVYRWQWTMALSITHRLTGLILGVGALMLVGWLLALASGPEAFAAVQSFLGSWFGRLLLIGWTWALFYHFANGIRHLFWDAGLGFDLDTARVTGYVVIAASFALTLVAWIGAYLATGGVR